MRKPLPWMLALALPALGSDLLAQATTTSASPATPAAQRTPARQVANGGRPITPADIKSWNSIRQSALSNDGKWFAYVQGPTEGDLTVVVRGTAQGATETRIPVGASGGSIQISGDSRWLGYLVTPNRPATGGATPGRGGRGAPGGTPGGGAPGGAAPGGAPGAAPGGAAAADTAARPGNKFVLMNLATGEKKEFNAIRNFRFNSTDAPTWLLMQGGSSGPGSADVLLYHIASGERQNMGRLAWFDFNDDGNWLAYTMDNPDQVGNALQLRNMKTGAIKAIDSEEVLYRHVAWTDSSRALSVMKGKIATTGTRDTTFTLQVFRDIGATGVPARTMKFSPDGRSDFPAGFKLASDRAPRYSADMSMVFFGMREVPKRAAAGRGNNPLMAAGAPGMGGNINQTAAGRGASGTAADSLASLILWHPKDERLQSQQMVQEASDRAFNYLVEYRFADDKFVRLADSTLRNVTVTGNDRFAFVNHTSPYSKDAISSGRNVADVYTIDLKTGARRLLWKARAGGSFGQVSPDGKKALFWGNDGHYWVIDLATMDSVNITKKAPVSFANTEDDHNNILPIPLPARGWSKDNASVILSDGWDIWKVPVAVSAAPVNLTGDGRTKQIRYRQFFNWDRDAAGAGRGGGGPGGPGGLFGAPAAQQGIDLSKPLYIGTYGEWTKNEGVSRVDPKAPGAKSILFEDARFAITKARDADKFVFTRQTFTDYPNFWASAGDFKGAYQITDVNPQINELAWSSGTRLIDYVSDKGDKLQAAMYLPADYDPNKKYPMLVTIYEKRSQNKNGFVNPSETQTPNARMYTSNGYIVLDPDIVYKINDPGMSAVWSVIPAVNAAIKTGSVDSTNIGLWGHSWGGYQTAFLVTQTNMFKSAIAGAALTDMVSMYSSVYWNTGGSNQAIFESSQGRFKGNFIDNYDAYIRNSPAFHAKKQQTPLILLHNDKDGAVDFNQGITHFNTLRQLGKEVILLEYVGENHGLARPVNQRDYASRMGEWFDHYLKGKPAPDWMKNGIPRLQMADHLASRKDSTGTAGRVIVP
ncbi:MAG TPA: prolyl oligopeptidase family serine peptidase [Gemmatimonas sp.]|nr:prolyl oligopeptidase family serine peptidase [Gemmatimonas sp.]